MENGMKSDVISCADMIQQAYSNIEKTAYEKNNKFSSAWKKILTSIKITIPIWDRIYMNIQM